MKYIAGIDIGNSTTEIAVARISDNNDVEFVSSDLVFTTGIKGTFSNKHGIFGVLKKSLDKVNLTIEDISLIRINEATPVIGDVAMETITETVVTESTMIGHNPKTPGGSGIGIGVSVYYDNISKVNKGEDVIIVVPNSIDFKDIANSVNDAISRGVNVNGLILQKDDGVLVQNRINKNIPIVDEVMLIDKVPIGMLCALEVALPGRASRERKRVEWSLMDYTTLLDWKYLHEEFINNFGAMNLDQKFAMIEMIIRKGLKNINKSAVAKYIVKSFATIAKVIVNGSKIVKIDVDRGNVDYIKSGGKRSSISYPEDVTPEPAGVTESFHGFTLV